MIILPGAKTLAQVCLPLDSTKLRCQHHLTSMLVSIKTNIQRVRLACGNNKCLLEAFESTTLLLMNISSSSVHYLASPKNWVELSDAGAFETLAESPTAGPALQMFKERQ